MNIPNYCSSAALQAAKHRIINPPGGNKYEHYVGSWACTMIKEVFNEDYWIITPERRDDYSNKRPDLIVEKIINGEPKIHLLMELKSDTTNIRFEDALDQVVNHIAVTMEEQVEAFVVVQRGTKIGFFEYHNDQSNLDEEDIPHFRGCISLTQNYEIEGVEARVLQNKPDNLLPLYYQYERLRKETELRKEAREYKEKCVFDLREHEEEINYLFHHMATEDVRSSV
jgi:hypothetical protein